MSNPPPEPSPSSETLQDKLGSILVKVLMAGGVGAGGFGAFWSLFKESDIPQAIASAAIGLGITYGASLLKPVDTGNRRRLEGAGQWMDGAIDGGIDQLFAKVSRAEDAYLLCQALDCRDYKSEGMGKRDRIMTPMLEEVFVPLELDSSAVSVGLQRRRQAMQDLRHHDIWDFLAEAERNPAYRQLAIVAWGGFGKTTLLKHLAYIYGTKQYRKYDVPGLIPVLLPLRQYRKYIAQESPLSLPELFMQQHLRAMAEIDSERDRLSKLPPDWFRDMLARGKVLVMMDGFDEIPENERILFSQWITQQMRCFDRSVFILTSRPTAYREVFEDSGRVEALRTKVWVRSLTADQQTKFVHQWYLSQEKLDRAGRDTPEVQRDARRNADSLLEQIRNPDRPELADLAKNPLLLNLLSTYHRSDPGVELPHQRAELYQDICSLQLRKRPAAREIVLPLSPEERQLVLQAIALGMMQQEKRLIEEGDLLDLLTQTLQAQNHEGLVPKEFLRQIVEVSELIVRQGLEGYEFSHLSFQEFLAARQIKETDQEALLYEFLKDADADGENQAWWRQTILLYAAQAKDPTVLIEEAMAQGANNLAYACYQESKRTLNPTMVQKLEALKPKVQLSRYGELEKLLQAGEWEAADKETYRLMITTVGKEEGQWFDLEDFTNFPCEDLRTIDRLWVDASNGHFGFSVQKKIWQECGSPKFSGKDWDRFCVKVGWQDSKATSYVSYSDLLKNPSLSPVGELPFGDAEGTFYGGVITVSILFSRAATCEL